MKPLYVNPKQYHRIQVRRDQRENLHKRIKFVPKKTDPYQYLSRHKHAKRRKRGPGGRFLTKQELAQLDKAESERKESVSLPEPETSNQAQLPNVSTVPGVFDSTQHAAGV